MHEAEQKRVSRIYIEPKKKSNLKIIKFLKQVYNYVLM